MESWAAREDAPAPISCSVRDVSVCSEIGVEYRLRGSSVAYQEVFFALPPSCMLLYGLRRCDHEVVVRRWEGCEQK